MCVHESACVCTCVRGCLCLCVTVCYCLCMYIASVCGGGGHVGGQMRETGMCEPPTFANKSSPSFSLYKGCAEERQQEKKIIMII